jgi:hypothetical protein
MKTITISTASPGSLWGGGAGGYNGTTWVENPCSEISINSVLFEDYLPDIKELERMCEEYPGLDKAYENFKTFYKLVEQDWRGKQKNKKS